MRYATSEDYLCWKENGELLIRECNTTTGKWHPENVVCKVHEVETDRYCPEDLLEFYDDDNSPICLSISAKPQRYDERLCYGSNSIVPLDLSSDNMKTFIQFLSAQNITQHWLPIRRLNRSTPFQIMLPGKRWGQIVEDDLDDILDSGSNHKCISMQYTLSININNPKKQKTEPIQKKVITDCNALLPSICAFHGDFITRTGCPEGFGALNYHPNECYGIDWKGKWIKEKQQKIHIEEYFQNRQVLRQVLKKVIPKERRYDYFRVDTFRDNSNESFVVLMNQKEMVKIENEETKKMPVLYKETIEPRKEYSVQLTLKVDAKLEELLLVVYNRQYLWHIDDDDKDYGIKCFTNSDYDLLKNAKTDLVWESKDKTKSIFKVKLVSDDPGEYWCEGHSFHNFQLIQTPKIIAAKEKRGHAFAIRINTTCNIITKQNLTSKGACNSIYGYEKTLARQIQDVLRAQSKTTSKDLLIHNVRIMSVERIVDQYIDCWIHLTASLKNSAVDNSDEESSEEDDSAEGEERIRHDTVIRMEVWTLLKQLIGTYSSNSSSIVVRSTQFCFPDQFRLENGDIYMWQKAERGQLGVLSRICLQENGMPLTRLCSGDFIHGAFWEYLGEDNISCQTENDNTKLTSTLYKLERSKTPRKFPERALKEVKSIFHEYSNKFLPVDINFAANILQTSVRNIDQVIAISAKNLTEQVGSYQLIKEVIPDLISIYNDIINIKDSTIKMSSQLNTTNKLLEVFEIAMNTLSIQSVLIKNIPYHGNFQEVEQVDASNEFEVLDFDDVGVSVKVSPNLLYFTIDPSVANISGIAIFENYNNSVEEQYTLKGAFKNETFRFLQSTHEVEDIIDEPNLQFGTYFPENLLRNLNVIANTLNNTENSETVIVIKVYSNDILFQPKNNSGHDAPLGRVISISLPGYSSHLPEDLPIIFRDQRNSSQKHTTIDPCKYWNFENWASDGIRVVNLSDPRNDIVLCKVSHLTPFAYLVGFNFTVDENIGVNVREIHDRALDIITLTGCSLSLLGICGIFITAAKFNSWREKPSSKVLLHLCMAIAFQMIVLCFVSTKEYSLHLILNNIIPTCVAIGAFLHYSVLVQFFWMLVIAYFQFKRYVQIFGRNRPTKFFMKSTAFCWGVPLVPVILVVVLDQDSFSRGEICYPSGYSLFFGIIFPVAIIIIANFIIFCLIIYNILRSSKVPIRHTDKPVLIHQIRLSILLFFLLGFTWCFGILSAMKAGIIFSYLFCVTATMQGFVIFIYFIILDPVTRNMWCQYFYRLCSGDKNTFQSSTSLKDTTQSLD